MVQPETRILFDLTGREKPDLMLNMHCGVGRTGGVKSWQKIFKKR